jgi:hypothetical protein
MTPEEREMYEAYKSQIDKLEASYSREGLLKLLMDVYDEAEYGGYVHGIYNAI